MLSIIDPIDEGKLASLLLVPNALENDTAKSSFNISSVRQAFDHAFNILTSAFRTMRNRRNRDPEFVSPGPLLSLVLNVPDDVIEHRKFIHDAVRRKHSSHFGEPSKKPSPSSHMIFQFQATSKSTANNGQHAGSSSRPPNNVYGQRKERHYRDNTARGKRGGFRARRGAPRGGYRGNHSFRGQ